VHHLFFIFHIPANLQRYQVVPVPELESVPGFYTVAIQQYPCYLSGNSQKQSGNYDPALIVAIIFS
jgi:hypothetical protein